MRTCRRSRQRTCVFPAIETIVHRRPAGLDSVLPYNMRTRRITAHADVSHSPRHMFVRATIRDAAEVRRWPAWPAAGSTILVLY